MKISELLEHVEIDRSKNPNYPNDPATIKHRIETAKSILSDPMSGSEERKQATAILAKYKKQGVAEGSIGDKIKRGVKNIKRGLQGWDKNLEGPGGEKLGDPKEIVRRNKGYSDETTKMLAKRKELGFPFGGDSTTGEHTPRGLQRKVLDREMKKRGLSHEQDVAETEKHEDEADYGDEYQATAKRAGEFVKDIESRKSDEQKSKEFADLVRRLNK